MSPETNAGVAAASVNGIAISRPGETVPAEELRQRACTELLRQAAQAHGLLAADDAACADGVISEAAAAAIEALLERELGTRDPSGAECRRHYEAHRAEFREGEKVLARHILFAVTPGVDVVALRKRAEAALLDVRCADPGGKTFADHARELSNCPSAAEGGELGWIEARDCAPEFARELFGRAEVGVLPRLVHSRFGLHVVEVLRREPGVDPSFEAVRAAVALSLKRQAWITALRQYLSVLGSAHRRRRPASRCGVWASGRSTCSRPHSARSAWSCGRHSTRAGCRAPTCRGRCGTATRCCSDSPSPWWRAFS
jgi:peptidyl-prolyl cis-trans isomerase C